MSTEWDGPVGGMGLRRESTKKSTRRAAIFHHVPSKDVTYICGARLFLGALESFPSAWLLWFAHRFSHKCYLLFRRVLNIFTQLTPYPYPTIPSNPLGTEFSVFPSHITIFGMLVKFALAKYTFDVEKSQREVPKGKGEKGRFR